MLLVLKIVTPSGLKNTVSFPQRHGAAAAGADGHVVGHGVAHQRHFSQQAAQRDVSAAFHDVILARELDSIARQNLQQKERHLEEARRKLSLGTATDYDVLAAEVAVENARPDLFRTEHAIRVTRDHLRFLLAIREGDVDAKGTLETHPFPLPSYETALAVALQRRPDLQDLRHMAVAREALLNIALSGDKPRLDFRGDWGRKDFTLPNPNVAEGGNISAGGTVWNAGVYLTFPFFDGLRARGQVQQARSDLATTEIELKKAEDAAALQIRTALDTVQETGKIVEALTGTVAQAERLHSLSEKGFELGVKTHLEVEDALLNLVQARANLARARRDHLVARINLDYVMGVLGEPPAPAA